MAHGLVPVEAAQELDEGHSHMEDHGERLPKRFFVE